MASRAKKKGKGLDVGTSFVYAAEKHGDDILFRSQRDAFFDVEHNDFTKEMLNKSKVKYIQKQDRLFVVGNEAMEFANIFSRNARRPLARGMVSPDEKEALPMLELLIQSVVGPPQYKSETVYYSIPGEPLDADANVTYHQNILKGFLSRLGYIPKPINEGLAVVFSELNKEDFTGIGLSFGGGMVNMCLSYMSVPVVTFSISKSGDWIDHQVAMAVGETASRICAVKELNFDLSKQDDLTKVENALSIYYNNLIEYLLEHIKREFEGSKKLPQIDKPVSVVLSGGTTLPKGFLQRFESLLSKAKWPIQVGEVRMAHQPLHSVAKGALIAAMADEEKK